MKASDDPSFGLLFSDDPVLKQAFVTDMVKRSAAALLHSTHKAFCKKLRGACVLEIGHERVFTAADAANCLACLHNQGVGEDQVPITFALESKLSASGICKHINEDRLFATNTKWDKNEHTQDDAAFMDCATNCTAHLNQLHAHIRRSLCQMEDGMEISVPTLDMHFLCAISEIRHPASSFTPESLPSNLIKFNIDAI